MLAALLTIFLLISSSDTDIKTNIAEYLNVQLKAYEKFEYQILKMPSGYSSIKILYEKDFKIAGNLGYLPVIIEKNNRSAQSFISLKLKLYKNVLVAVRNLNRKEELSKSDFIISLQDVAGINGKPFTDVESINTFRSKKNLKEGNILTKNDIEKIPVVKVGDKIVASVVQGNVMIQFDAISKQEGGVGDIIKIVTSDNKKFKAKVVDFNNVIIYE